MQMVEDIKICSKMVSWMVNIPILGHFHQYVRSIEVTILSNSAVKYNVNTTSVPFQWPSSGPYWYYVEESSRVDEPVGQNSHTNGQTDR
jgi:hypothetical protein